MNAERHEIGKDAEELNTHSNAIIGCAIEVHRTYKGRLLSDRLRLDLLVEGCVIVECKAREQLSASDKPQFLSYLRVTNLPLGLLINFHEQVLKNGLHRIVNRIPSSLSATSEALAPQRS